MQQFSFIDLFIDLFEFALHVLGDKLAHLHEHFLTVYTAFGIQCTDIAADRWQGWDGESSNSNFSPGGSNIGALNQSCIYSQKVSPEDGGGCCPKHVEPI